MADCMNFPDDPMEFIKGYSFKDEEQIYTNGAELISVLRVQQMIEHYFSDKNGWISVKDRLPDLHQNVLVFVQHPSSLSYVCIAWRSAFLRSWEIDSQEYGEDQDGIVTHWMPMPEPPGEEKEETE